MPKAPTTPDTVDELLASARRMTEELGELKARTDLLADQRADVFDQLRGLGVSVRHIAAEARVSHSAVNATLRVRRERTG